MFLSTFPFRCSEYWVGYARHVCASKYCPCVLSKPPSVDAILRQTRTILCVSAQQPTSGQTGGCGPPKGSWRSREPDAQPEGRLAPSSRALLPSWPVRRRPKPHVISLRPSYVRKRDPHKVCRANRRHRLMAGSRPNRSQERGHQPSSNRVRSSRPNTPKYV